MNKDVSRRTFVKSAAMAGAAMALGVPSENVWGNAAVEKPNIVFIFTDQQHWHAAGYMDPFYASPALDSLAAQGTVFTRAYCSTPQCSPSRSTLMTGLYPHKTGVMGNIDAAGGNAMAMDSVGKKLQAAGYYTGYFGKWHIGDDANGTAGWDREAGVRTPKKKGDEGLAENCTGFLDSALKQEKPFALYVSINNPHDIYQYGSGVRAAEPVAVDLPASYAAEDFSTVPGVQKQFMDRDQGRVMNDKDEEGWKAYRNLYRDKVRLADGITGAIIGKLKKEGLFDDALIIYTSDHGDMETHNRLVYKGPFMYDHMLRVPLVIKVPGQRTARRTGGMSVNADLVPTVLEFAGCPAGASDGLSLKPLLTGAAAGTGHDYIIAQYYGKQKWVNPIRTIITEKYKYNRYLENGEELYDLQADPGEVKNLAGAAAFMAVKDGLSAKLDAWMAANDDPFNTFVLTDRAGTALSVHDFND